MALFYENIKKMLCDTHLEKALRINPDILKQLAEQSVWRVRASEIVQSTPVVVSDVIQLATDFLTALGISLPDDWRRTVYTYGTHQLFADNFDEELSPEMTAAAIFTLDLIGLFLDKEMEMIGPQEWLDFVETPPETIPKSRYRSEFSRLRNVWDAYYIQEILRIGREAEYYDLLAHITGVHRIAVTVGKQLYDAGVPIDLPLVSGAAMVHDLGKFGCRNTEEIKRMAYLHYYYTEEWCNRHDMLHMGHVAMTHSTWDLELENLPVESLVLIYSDFRVKAADGPRGDHEVMKIYSLAESFEVILNKLDNVDEAKRNRYQRVYNKLADFEAYMISCGVDVTLGEKEPAKPVPNWIGTINAAETPSIFKNLAFEHNIAIMDVLGDPDYLRNMLESLRANGHAVDIRANLNIFEEYITYMTRPQKELIFSYLLEMLIHPEGDIRRQSSRLIGQLISGFNERYSKWLPDDRVRIIYGRTAVDLWEELLSRIFDPDHKLGDRYRRFQGYAFQTCLVTLLGGIPEEEVKSFIEPLMHYYVRDNNDLLTSFILLDSLTEIPVESISEEEHQKIIDFTLKLLKVEDVEIRLAALGFLEVFVAKPQLNDAHEAILEAVMACEPIWHGEGYLVAQIRALIVGGQSIQPAYKPSEIFLENLKSSTPWLAKRVNIRRLADGLIDNPNMNRLHVALHFSNLLKVSEQIAVRHDAGQMLVQIAPLLTPEEVNEVVVELYRGLEMDSFEFTKYIPEYLARFAANLQPNEYDEFVETVAVLLDSNNKTVAQLALDTLAHTAAVYNEYSNASSETKEKRRYRLSFIMGHIMKGLASYHARVRIESLSDISQIIFGNSQLSLTYKCELFDIIYKRLLMLMIYKDEEEKEIFYGHCAVFNQIYRFIAEYSFFYQALPLFENRKVAFFPGTFDPFTLGHKEIVRHIRDQGFDVYLGLDEFSWSKNTQPAEIRRNILQMSVACEENVFIFPSMSPINIASSEDLKKLTEYFAHKQLYLVVGTDVVRGASAYRGERTEYSIHTFNHIIVDRSEQGFTEETNACAKSLIEGDIIQVSLPDILDGVSSTIIRRNIDKNRDISHLIDKMAQNYIYDNNLYLGELKLKPVKNPSSIHVTLLKGEASNIWEDIEELLEEGNELGAIHLLANGELKHSRLISVYDHDELVSVALVQIITSPDLYDIVDDRDLARNLREKGASRMAVISHLKAKGDNEEYAQLAMTNALLWAIEATATLAIYRGGNHTEKERIQPLLKRHGFIPLSVEKCDRWYFLVNMRMPILLANNVATLLKEPFRSLPEVKKVLFDTHCKLQHSLTSFHPGELVLSYNSLRLEGDLAKIIAEENGVPSRQEKVRVLGDAMCVPFGHLLRRSLVPNTVTRPLFVQRLYQADMRFAEVQPLPYYDDVSSQARVVHSFKRPIILTDEVLNRGRTLEILLPILDKQQVPIRCMACGIITGSGRDLLVDYHLRHRSVHYLPNLRYWLVDSKGYPFIDGYSRADRPVHVTRGLETVINPILPYSAPPLFRESAVGAAWHYSKVSLENALAIMKALEKVYQERNERNLTLNRLPEVFTRPMIPDPGEKLTHDLTMNPSWYLEQDLARLNFLQNIIPKDDRYGRI